MNAPDPFPGSIEDRAADWLARRDAGFAPADAAAFAQWRAADPRHAAAVRELENAWTLLGRPRAAGQAARVLADLEKRARIRHFRRARRFTLIGSGLAAAAAIALAVWLPSRLSLPPAAATAVTVTPRPERQLLADGSVVELNAGAEISVAFTAGRRDVRLLRGEAHFEVAHDPARPFVVTAAGIETRAVGTAFSVRLAEQDVRVLVTAGRVAVAPPAVPAAPTAAERAPVLLDAGNRVTVALADPAAPAPESVSPAEIAASLAWRNQRVEFSGTPLAEAVALFNARNRVQLALADPALGSLRVSGIYWANDAAGFARLIGASFSLQVLPSAPDRLELRRMPDRP